MSDEKPNSPRPAIAPHKRLQLLAIAWGITAVAIVAILWGMLYFLPFFPIFSPAGFLVGVGISHSNHSLNVAAVVGWLYYAALSVWAYCTGRRSRFYWIYCVLCISLLLNLAGCEAARLNYNSSNYHCSKHAVIQEADAR